MDLKLQLQNEDNGHGIESQGGCNDTVLVPCLRTARHIHKHAQSLEAVTVIREKLDTGLHIPLQISVFIFFR